MEGFAVSTGRARPVGVLEPLGDALSAAFDEEMAMWREVAQLYCSPLREDPQRRAKPDEDEAGQLTGDLRSDTMSQSDPTENADPVESVSEHGDRTNSLADKWAEVEELLATIRPAHQARIRTRRPDRVAPLRRLVEVETRQPLARRQARRNRHEDMEDRDHTLEACQQMIRAWAALALARRKFRDQRQTAERHWRQAKCSSSFSRWRGFCQRQHFLQESSNKVTLFVQKRQLSTALQHWWTMRRWSRGQRLLLVWRDERRRQKSFSCWLELVEMSRKLKQMRQTTMQKRTRDVFARWNEFVDQQKRKRDLRQRATDFRLRRYLRFFVSGIQVSRTRRLALAVVSTHHQRKVFGHVLHAWIDYNTRQRRKKMAVEWWTHCLLSSSFETWNLLHRCFVYRNRQNGRARACYSSCVLRRSLVSWRKLVLQRHQQRVGLARIIVRRLQRMCFTQLESAVSSERALGRQLQQWKLRRRIQTWHLQARRRVLIAKRRRQLEAMNRARLLHSFAWQLWRDACESRRQIRRLIALAEQNVVRAWWRRWKDFVMIVKARRAISQIVDMERNRRQQRRAIQRWWRFCVSKIELKAASTVSTQHYSTAKQKATFHCWKTWLWTKRASRGKAADADNLFVRHCFWRWHARAHNQKKANYERAETISRRHPLWLKRAWFTVWRRNSKRRAVGRVRRIFALWRQFVMRVDQNRQAKQLGESIRLRQSWRRWATSRAKKIRASDFSQLLKTGTEKQLLYKAFIKVWWSKTNRFSDARHKIQKIRTSTTMQHAFQRWQKQVLARKLLLRATEWNSRCVRLKTLRALYLFSIVRPRELTKSRRIGRMRRLFAAWARETPVRRRFRQAALHLDQWRKKKLIGKLLARWKRRHHHEELARFAQLHHQRRLRRIVFDGWLRFTASTLTCREASDQIRFAARLRVFKSWQRALARQLFVHELEAHFDHALLRQTWTNFRDAIQLKQAHRREWLARLSTVLLRKTLQRWHQLVEVQNLQLLVASSRASKAQHRLLHQVFDEWTHFATIRAFVAVRQRREARAFKTSCLRHWKLYVLLRYRERRREQQVKSKAFTVLKKHAIVSEASREIQYRSYQNALVSTWKAWRLEFWMRQSHKTSSVVLLRRCFDAWRSATLSRADSNRGERRISHISQSNPLHRDSAIQWTAFAHATLLQDTVQRQRVMMQRVVHAWALAARTCKRQRRKEKVRIFKARCSSMGSRQVYSGLPEGENDENVNPNTRTTKTTIAKVSSKADEEEAERMALEHWSSRLLQTAFDEWRSRSFR